MNDDRILEFMALMSDYMRSIDRRFEQLTTVMNNGFERVNTQLGQLITEVRATNQRVDLLTDEVRVTNQRVDVLTDEVRVTNQRVDVLTDEVREVKADVREMKTEAQAASRRLNATFDHVAFLTEENTAKGERLKKLEAANDDTQQRLQAFEEFMRRAS